MLLGLFFILYIVHPVNDCGRDGSLDVAPILAPLSLHVLNFDLTPVLWCQGFPHHHDQQTQPQHTSYLLSCSEHQLLAQVFIFFAELTRSRRLGSQGHYGPCASGGV